MPLNSRIKTYRIVTNDDEVCIPSLSSILICVHYERVLEFGTQTYETDTLGFEQIQNVAMVI